MKKYLITAAALYVALLSGCGERVEPNKIGVLMENYGKTGKSDFSLQRGKVYTWGMGTQLYQVPLWEQKGGFDAANPMNLKASDNTAFTSVPSYSYRVIEARAVDVVFNNRQIGNAKDFLDQLEANVLNPKIYNILKDASRTHATEELMQSGGQTKLEAEVEVAIKKAFDDAGLELLTLTTQLEFSEKVTAKIDTRNEVNQNIAVLDQKIAEQKKQNELAELQAQENLTRSKGITPQLLQSQFIEKWDGKTPLYGNMPITLLKSDK